jgi:hypothetical protein
VITALWLAAGAHPVRADTPAVKLDVGMDLKADGSLVVKSTITVRQGADVADRLPLDIPVEGTRIQHFQVSDVATTGGASAKVDDRTLVVSAPRGTSTVSYTVRGSVENGPELQRFTWLVAAGWDVPVETLTGTFISPATAPDSPICAVALVGELRLCTLTQTDVQGKVTFQNNNIQVGKVVVFSVLLPPGTVTATAHFTPAAPGTASSGSRDTGGFVALAVATGIAFAVAGLAWLRRRADEAGARAADTTAELLVPHGNGLAFASPDGVLPGQIGMLTTGRVRPADIGATVLDLAVRNYLWIAELPGPSGVMDFQISRRAPLDGAVTVFERAVVDAILPDNRETTLASELTHGALIDLAGSRAAITASVVDGGWLRRDATRGYRRLEAVGFALLGVGAVAAVCLALAGTGALWAASVAVLGGGVAAAARLLPLRTGSGSRLAAGVGGMRQYLAGLNLGGVDEAVRPVLFQRAIPYAHSLGELRGWLGRWGPSRSVVEWYRAAGDGPSLAELPTLAAVLDGMAAQSEAAQER